MGSVAAEVVQIHQDYSCAKVHNLMCRELMKVLGKIIGIIPAIESARPGCSVGIQELCSLNNTVEKAKLLIQHCTESSKLYLAITGDSIVLRCERIRSSWRHSLGLIQNMVPQILAVQISGVLDFLRDAKFVIDSAEDEAGKAMLELLGQPETSDELEFKAFQTAASGLRITYPKALLIEKRSIKRLLDKINGNDPKKVRILNYFLYLINKYGKKVKADTERWKGGQSPEGKCLNPTATPTPKASTLENNNVPNDLSNAGVDSIVSSFPPENFCCPISSRLMCDPVVIDSGQTFERVCIEEWFSQGHDTCPKTQKKLKNLYMISNSSMKDLIYNWCREHGINLEDPSAPVESWEPSHCSSILSLKNVSADLLNGKSGDYMIQSDNSSASFMSSDASYSSDSSLAKSTGSMKDNHAPLFSWSEDYQRSQSFSNFSQEMYLRFFAELCELPLDQREEALKALELLEGDEEMCYAMLANGFVEAIMKFIKNAHFEMQVQRTAAQIFLGFLSNSRVEIPSLDQDEFQLLTSFLETEIALEALMILEKLSHHPNSKSIITTSGFPTIIKVLDCDNVKFLELAIKILLNLSSRKELKSHLVSSGCISKLVPLLSNGRLAELCIRILHNLSVTKEAVVLIAETSGCIASIAELLETGTRIEQEHSVAILHSLCSQSLEYCLLVMKEGVIPSLVSISVNGTPKGMETSLKLLHLLKDLRLSGSFESSDSQSQSPSEPPPEDLTDKSTTKQPILKSSGFFARKMRVLLKPRPVALS